MAKIINIGVSSLQFAMKSMILNIAVLNFKSRSMLY